MAGAVSVFVRVRPLTPAEGDAMELDGLTLRTSDPGAEGVAVALESGSSSVGGFTGVLGQEARNRDVFDRCFAPRVGAALRGGAASLFCYGYTGGGKTHTAVGYGEERGLYFLAAERLLDELRRLHPAAADEDSALFLRATACEIYGDAVFDLLCDGDKARCALRVDHTGQLNVSQKVSEQLGGVAPGGRGEHATLFTVDQGLRPAAVRRAEDLDDVYRRCVARRASGRSTTHHQSSRSHAVLRLEVVSGAAQRARDALAVAEAQLPAVRNARDNAWTQQFKTQYSGPVGKVLRVKHGTPVAGVGVALSEPGDLWVKDGGVTGEQQDRYALRDVEGGDVPRTAAEWAEQLRMPGLHMEYVISKSDQSMEEWKLSQAEWDRKLGELRAMVLEKEAEVAAATAALDAVLARGPAALGGSVLLVDLAGADYDHRAGAAQKESAAINKSLLTLKECLRALAGVSARRAPFRDSKLTRVLEDSLAPAASSARRNKESVSVMLVNVSPAARLERGTVNALRYGQMYSGGGRAAAGAGGRTVGVAGGARGYRGAAAPKPWQRAPAAAPAGADVLHHNEEVLGALRGVYEQHAPEKSAAEVEAIIARFAGREAELLGKVRAKYQC